MRISRPWVYIVVCSSVMASCVGARPPVPPKSLTSSAKPAEKPARACSDLDGCRASCDGGEIASCEVWFDHVRARPLGVTVEVATTILDRACSAGRGKACLLLTNVVQMSPELAANSTRAAALLDHACANGEPIACISTQESAFTDHPGSDALVALRESIAELSHRCDAHDGASCAIASAVSLGMASNPAEAKRLATRAGDELETSCLAGHDLDCMLGGLQVSSPMAPEPERARRLFERGCALGSGPACTAAARMKEGTRDERAARFDQACKLGDAEGCLEVAGLGGAGGTDPKAASKSALAIGLAGCALGEGMSCDAAVRALRTDGQERADVDKTLALSTRYCERGGGPTCAELAKLYREGPPSLRDADRAKALAKQACDHDYPFACHDPMAVLGVYPPLEVPVLDSDSLLEWTPPSAAPVAVAEANLRCAETKLDDRGPFHLPTRAELATLAEAGDGLKPFASATSPKGGVLLASEESDSIAIAMSVRHGTFDHARSGFYRCARFVEPKKEPRIDTLTLSAQKGDIAYELKSSRGRVKLASKIVGGAQNQRVDWVWDGTNFPGPADIAVASDLGWMTALQMVAIAIHDGLHVRRIVVMPSPKPR